MILCQVEETYLVLSLLIHFNISLYSLSVFHSSSSVFHRRSTSRTRLQYCFERHSEGGASEGRAVASPAACRSPLSFLKDLSGKGTKRLSAEEHR